MKLAKPSLLTVWSLWIVILMALSAGAYLFDPRLPVVNLVADRVQFVGADEVRIRFELDRPASGQIAIRYRLGGDAARGVDYEAAPGDLVVQPGDSSATLLVDRSGKSVNSDQPGRSLIVELSEAGGYRHGQSNKLVLTFPGVASKPVLPASSAITTVRLSSSSNVVGLASTSEVVVTFELDRDVDRRTAVGFLLGGDAKEGLDYVVKGHSAGDEVIFEPGQRQSSITVERPDRGNEPTRGDRQILIFLDSRPEEFASDPTPLKLSVPDFGTRLSWHVEPATKFSRDADRKVYLRLSLDRPSLDSVTLRYRFGGDAQANVDYVPPVEPTLSISEGKRDGRQQVFTIKADPLVGGPRKVLDLIVEEVNPKYFAQPSPLKLTLTDEGPLVGRSLVLLVLTEELVRHGEKVLGKVEALTKDQESDLVGGCVYILAGDAQIYRAGRHDKPLEGRTPFPRDATAESILQAASTAIRRQFGGRIQAGNYRTIMIWQDLTVRRSAAGADDHDNVRNDGRCHLLWLGPSGPLPQLLVKYFPPVADSERFHAIPGPDDPEFSAHIDRWIQGR